jgi:carboxyl-terminal processing protease
MKANIVALGCFSDRAGILPNDIITQVDDETAQELGRGQLITKFTRPAGTKIKLTLTREGLDRPIEKII